MSASVAVRRNGAAVGSATEMPAETPNITMEPVTSDAMITWSTPK